jgi:hypothetical protein
MITLSALVTLYSGGPGSGCNGPNCGRPASQNLKRAVARMNRQHLTSQQKGDIRVMKKGLTTAEVLKTYQLWKDLKDTRKEEKQKDKQQKQKVRKQLAKVPKISRRIPVGIVNKKGMHTIPVQPVSRGRVKTRMNIGNGTQLTILKPKAQYEKTNATWLQKASPYKGMFTRVIAMDQFDDNKTKNSIWMYRDANNGVMLQVSRQLGQKAVSVKEVDTKDFEFITRTREAQFNNIGRASGFLNKRYGVTFKLGGPA